MYLVTKGVKTGTRAFDQPIGEFQLIQKKIAEYLEILESDTGEQQADAATER